MNNNSLIEMNHAISTAFRELVAAQKQLDDALESVERARESIGSIRVKTNSAFIDALTHFHSHPSDTSSEIFHGICRLADDAGFESIAEQLRQLHGA